MSAYNALHQALETQIRQQNPAYGVLNATDAQGYRNMSCWTRFPLEAKKRQHLTLR